MTEQEAVQELQRKKEYAKKILTLGVGRFGSNKEKENALKKVNTGDSEQIKEALATLGLTSFTEGGYTVTRSVTIKDEFDEDVLIAHLKTLGIPKEILKTIIKKKEYVDYDGLEDAIYADLIDAASLTKCQTSREVITLRVKKQKED